MKLYEIKLPARVYCKCSDGSEFIDVHHLDGMYSYCTTERGGVAHLCVFEELEQHADGYRVIDAQPEGTEAAQ